MTGTVERMTLAIRPPTVLSRMMIDPLSRIRQVDWTGKPEATIGSELVTPVLFLLGYGSHTAHPVKEQHTYKLKDPFAQRGSRRVRLDYEPTVYEQGLWVLEIKGSDVPARPETLGQVRDYATHPEIRAALMVTVDAAGFNVFDPWDPSWTEPILAVPLNEVGDRIEELRDVLGADRVAEVIRRRHLDHLERAMSASLEFGVLEDATREFEQKVNAAREAITKRRDAKRAIYEREATERHERVLRSAGVWGVAQHWNSPWVGNRASTQEFRTAVLMQEPRQRPTQIRQFRPAIEAIFKNREVASGQDYLYRPLWWLHIVVLGGTLAVRGEENCEPAATDVARTAIRDCVLGFPDDPVAAAAWRYQRALIPMVIRIAAVGPLDDFSRRALAKADPEFKLEFPHAYRPAWIFETTVKATLLQMLAAVDPWTPERLDELAIEAREMKLPRVPELDELGPAGDPYLDLWQDTDPLLECALFALGWSDAADDLVREMPDVEAAIAAAHRSPNEFLRRAASAIAGRLNLA